MSATNQRRSKSGSAKSVTNKPSINKITTLLSKEEEYLKLNAELEAKTATLVYEADQVLKENEKLLSETSLLSCVKNSDYLNNIISNLKNETETNQLKFAPSSLLKQPNHIQYKKSIKSGIELDEFQKAIENVEKTIEPGWNEVDDEEKDDIVSNCELIPKQATGMSNEAQIRFLKAKLRVMQEETVRLNLELKHKDDENTKLVQRCKELDDDKQRNSRLLSSNQVNVDNLKKKVEELTQKLSQSDIQLQSVKKEFDASKKAFKKHQQDETQAELRINRLLEENEKYKQQFNKVQIQSKDINEQEKKKIEQLQIDNKRLEKQKQELIQAFKKQLKLIDILKKQKMHLEASKMLQFSEEEFLKALEWNQATSNANYEAVQNQNFD